MCTQSGLSLERSTATCGPRGRGQPFDTEMLPGVDTPEEGGEGSDDHKCLQRQELSQDRIRGRDKKESCDHPLPSPSPSRPPKASYITPPGVSPRRASGAGGEDSPRGRRSLFPHRGRGPEPGQESSHRLRPARVGPPGFRFPALALTQPHKPIHRHHNKGGDAAATPGWKD